MRTKVAEILLKSSKSGALATAIQTAKTSPCDIEKLRQKAAIALVNANSNGAVQDSFPTKSLPAATNAAADSELDLLRLNAQKTLAEALNSGKLEQIMATKSACQDDDLDCLRQKARDALYESAATGSLEKALTGNIPGSQRSLAEIRSRAAEKLMNASGNGELEKVMASISMQV